MAEAPPKPSSGSSTPNPRFTSQGHTTEDLLKEQTYGLVHLSDFRKRRAEALEQSERGSRDGTPSGNEAATQSGRESPANAAAFKKRKKGVKKIGLSFGDDDNEEMNDSSTAVSRSATPAQRNESCDAAAGENMALKKRGLKPNSTLPQPAPKVLTKSAMLREQQLKEQLRKEYTQIQDAVKETEFVLPFTFFNGKSSPGGICRMKKGDQIWLFLERARKVGADMADKGDRTKKDWARIGVDDLMVVRGDLIIPNHYDFHYFIINRTVGYKQKRLFDYSSEPTVATPKHLLPSSATTSHDSTPEPPADPDKYISTAASRKQNAPFVIPDSGLEGYNDDPGYTKVVDRRWYERNKHIYPASLWEEFDPERDYSKTSRKDAEGNAMFFGR